MADPSAQQPVRAADIPGYPQAVLLYSTAPLAFPKLKAVLHLHEATCTEPLPNTLLVSREADLLAQVVSQWREYLDGAELAEVRGVLLDTPTPSADELARALLHLADLDYLLARLQGRWLLRLLQGDCFFVMFQPLVSVAERRTVAYECLIRARDTGRTFDAKELLGTARTMGLIHQLDQAAWRRAFKQGGRLVHQGHSLFVNFTPSSITDPRFGLWATMATCQEHGVPFERLVFEVTEAEAVRDLTQLKKIIADYRGEGAQVALDDLGSGYSSILHLAELLPNYVKLDQELVRGAYNDYVRSVLLKAVTDAAHELGILVVAEGVETEEDLKFCIALDADLVQGYFLARPAESPPAVSQEAMQTLEVWVRDAEGEK